MFRRLCLAVMLASTVAGCSAPSAPDPVPTETVAPTLSGVAASIVELTNTERTRAGLASFTANSQLMEAARIQAEQVAAAGRLEHTLPEARYPSLQDRIAAAGYAWQAIGENLAFGQRNAAEVVAGWMASSGHRANILNPTFTEIGVGYIVDPNGRPYYVQVFGRPR